MNLASFLHSHEKRKQRFQELLLKSDDLSWQDFSHGEVKEWISLYRSLCSDLSFVKAHLPDKERIRELSNLAAQGYQILYRHSFRVSWKKTWGDFFLIRIPEACQRHLNEIFKVTISFLLGAFLGFFLVCLDLNNVWKLLPGEFFTQDVNERVREAEQKERIRNIKDASGFSTYLFTHNIRVAFFSFGIGMLFVYLGHVFIFWNGLILGTITAQYLLSSQGVFLLAWIGPHGALEIPSLIFSGAAGLLLGKAFYFASPLSRWESVRRISRDLTAFLIAAICFLGVAGCIEGSFSQFGSSIIPYSFKIAFALIVFAGLLIYCFYLRKPAP